MSLDIAQGYKRKFVWFIAYFIYMPFCFSQIHSRVSADFSIKERFTDASQRLTMGKVYFDKNQNQILYHVSFPDEKFILVRDTLIAEIKNQQVISRSPSRNVVSFSVFNLAVNGRLPYYGIKKTAFELQDVKKEGEQVISTWRMPPEIVKDQGDLVLSLKNGNLQGLVTLKPDGSVFSKQLFEEYTNVNGLAFPGKVVQFMYKPAGGEVKITTYKNIKVNDFEDNTYYHYRLPNGN